ncbi:MAG: hypothetical protein Q4G25_05495 [Paracoccus sp. (in: a-proteobacteria)]|nr:hypothetical protein [Paracoccus sp. (in: a-proteobacteria)]
MFEFHFDDLPPVTLDIARARITLFAHVPPYEDRIDLNIAIDAVARDVTAPGEDGETHLIAPQLYTDYLSIPLTALRSGDAGLLDGWRMSYDPGDDASQDQAPGAIYQYMHDPFLRATMELTSLGGADYRLRAEGETISGWRFRIDTPARLTSVEAKSGQLDGDLAPSPEVEDWYRRHFEPAVFAPGWQRRGNPATGWYVLAAEPKAPHPGAAP